MSPNPLVDCYRVLGFKNVPFSITPDTGLFFPNNQHVAAFTQIRHACIHGMLAVLTGEVGLGKTLVIRTVMRQLPEEVKVAYLINPLLDPLELLREIFISFSDAPMTHDIPASDLQGALLQLVMAGISVGHHYAVIVDEAHRLHPEALEVLRLLSNLETEQQKLISLVLVGQPELERTLMLRAMRPLRERIGVWLKLVPLSRVEMDAYILHRIRMTHQVGRFEFTPMALRHLYRRTRGVPRRVNYACEKALLLAYAQGQKQVGWSLARQACQEFSRVWS
jgi:general secretion pathway protein A